MHQSELRALVARMQQQVTSSGGADLTSAWNSLVSHLNLGDAPDTRECPHCKREIMRAATLCGHCWTKVGDSQHA